MESERLGRCYFKRYVGTERKNSLFGHPSRLMGSGADDLQVGTHYPKAHGAHFETFREEEESHRSRSRVGTGAISDNRAARGAFVVRSVGRFGLDSIARGHLFGRWRTHSVFHVAGKGIRLPGGFGFAASAVPLKGSNRQGDRTRRNESKRVQRIENSRWEIYLAFRQRASQLAHRSPSGIQVEGSRATSPLLFTCLRAATSPLNMSAKAPFSNRAILTRP